MEERGNSDTSTSPSWACLHILQTMGYYMLDAVTRTWERAHKRDIPILIEFYRAGWIFFIYLIYYIHIWYYKHHIWYYISTYLVSYKNHIWYDTSSIWYYISIIFICITYAISTMASYNTLIGDMSILTSLLLPRQHIDTATQPRDDFEHSRKSRKWQTHRIIDIIQDILRLILRHILTGISDLLSRSRPKLITLDI